MKLLEITLIVIFTGLMILTMTSCVTIAERKYPEDIHRGLN